MLVACVKDFQKPIKGEKPASDPVRGTLKDHTSSLDIGVRAKVRRIPKSTLPRENMRHFNILNVFTRDLSDAVGMCAERMSRSKRPAHGAGDPAVDNIAERSRRCCQDKRHIELEIGVVMFQLFLSTALHSLLRKPLCESERRQRA